MKHLHYPDVEAVDSLALGLEGSERMVLRLLSEDSVCIELAPGGRTPHHAHPDKERFVVISGEGRITVNEEQRPLGPRDFVELGGNERHQIVNNGPEKLVFVCFRNQK